MSVRIHAIVNYICANDLFNLDVMDLQDMHGSDVLRHFVIDEVLSKWEEVLFMQEMLRLAHRFQTAEISRCTPVELYTA